MNDLTLPQKELIAGLTQSPAFSLLLRLMEGGVAALEEGMIKAGNDKDALHLLHLWKAVKWSHKVLKTQPESYMAELQEMLEERNQKMGGVEFEPVLQRQFSFGDAASKFAGYADDSDAEL